DITPLGINLHKNTTSPDWSTKAIAADGDGNGEVNLADITPIGQGFHANVEAYSVQSTATPGNAASWADAADVPFSQSFVDSALSPLAQFDFTLPAPVDGAYYR